MAGDIFKCRECGRRETPYLDVLAFFLVAWKLVEILIWLCEGISITWTSK